MICGGMECVRYWRSYSNPHVVRDAQALVLQLSTCQNWPFCCIALTEKGIKFLAHRELAMGYATAVNIANDAIPTFATLTPALPAASWIRASMVISTNSSLSSSMA